MRRISCGGRDLDTSQVIRMLLVGPLARIHRAYVSAGLLMYETHVRRMEFVERNAKGMSCVQFSLLRSSLGVRSTYALQFPLAIGLAELLNTYNYLPFKLIRTLYN